MIKKSILFLFAFFLITSICYATNPFPDKIVKTSDGKIIVKLVPHSFGKADLIIEDQQGKIKKGFTLDALGITPEEYQITTAGNDWYQNSIAFINKTGEYFIVRLKGGRQIVIDLKSNKLAIDIPRNINVEINRTTAQIAIKLLNSENPRERQTGAIFCGQLKIKEAIPKLRVLLSDKEFLSEKTGDNPWMIVLYVRKAAKEALIVLGEDVRNVITELPEKGNLKIDDKTGRYVVVFEEENRGN